MNFICWLFGHKSKLKDSDVSKSFTCKRCGKHQKEITWPREVNTNPVMYESPEDRPEPVKIPRKK